MAELYLLKASDPLVGLPLIFFRRLVCILEILIIFVGKVHRRLLVLPLLGKFNHLHIFRTLLFAFRSD